MRCRMVIMSTLNRCGDRSMSRRISFARWKMRASASVSATEEDVVVVVVVVVDDDALEVGDDEIDMAVWDTVG